MAMSEFESKTVSGLASIDAKIEVSNKRLAKLENTVYGINDSPSVWEELRNLKMRWSLITIGLALAVSFLQDYLIHKLKGG